GPVGQLDYYVSPELQWSLAKHHHTVELLVRAGRSRHEPDVLVDDSDYEALLIASSFVRREADRPCNYFVSCPSGPCQDAVGRDAVQKLDWYRYHWIF